MSRYAQASLSSGDDADVAVDSSRVFSVRAMDEKGETVDLAYTNCSVTGHGSFGVVMRAELVQGGEGVVALKRTRQDRRFKNRELQIMRLLHHPNIFLLRYYYYEAASERARRRRCVPRSGSGLLPRNDLQDFGSAKVLKVGEPNVSYTCSRYYRAPELIFRSTKYSLSIDICSSGCILGEPLSGSVLFAGSSGIDQLVEIIKVLGTPSKEQISTRLKSFFAQSVQSHSLASLLPKASPQALDLLTKLLAFDPSERIFACEAMAHPFFDELRISLTALNPNGVPFPKLFDFSRQELSVRPVRIRQLVPPWAESALWNESGVDVTSFRSAGSGDGSGED